MAQISFSFRGPEATTSASTVGSNVNVAIQGLETGTTNIVNLFEIVLYEAQTSWDGFVAQVTPTDATDTEHMNNYSDYAMAWYCNLVGTKDAIKAGSACCLKDIEDTEGGGYCLKYEDATTVKTLWMVDSDFNTATGTADYILPANKEVVQTGVNLGFETFDCTGGINVDANFACTKL